MKTELILPTLALTFGLAPMTEAAAQTEAPEWRLVVSEGGTDLYYDANTVLATEDGVRVRTRGIAANGAPLPGGEGDYDSTVEIMLVDCDAQTYATGERAFFDVNGAELSTTVTPEGAKPYAPDSGVGLIAGMVCPLPTAPAAPPAD